MFICLIRLRLNGLLLIRLMVDCMFVCFGCLFVDCLLICGDCVVSFAVVLLWFTVCLMVLLCLLDALMLVALGLSFLWLFALLFGVWDG